MRRRRVPTGGTFTTPQEAAQWLHRTLDRVQDVQHPDGWINVFEPEIIQALEQIERFLCAADPWTNVDAIGTTGGKATVATITKTP